MKLILEICSYNNEVKLPVCQEVSIYRVGIDLFLKKMGVLEYRNKQYIDMSAFLISRRNTLDRNTEIIIAIIR